jgi:hypothetical protein
MAYFIRCFHKERKTVAITLEITKIWFYSHTQMWNYWHHHSELGTGLSTRILKDNLIRHAGALHAVNLNKVGPCATEATENEVRAPTK